MYSSYMCLIYSRICFLMKSDPRTYHMEDPEWQPRVEDLEWQTPSSSSIESYMAEKRRMAEKRASKRNEISYMAETRDADDTHKNVGKKRCTEGSESL